MRAFIAGAIFIPLVYYVMFKSHFACTTFVCCFKTRSPLSIPSVASYNPTFVSENPLVCWLNMQNTPGWSSNCCCFLPLNLDHWFAEYRTCINLCWIQPRFTHTFMVFHIHFVDQRGFLPKICGRAGRGGAGGRDHGGTPWGRGEVEAAGLTFGWI